MKQIIALVMMLSAASIAHAQQASAPVRLYTFTVTPEEANTTLNKLGEIPWKDVNPLIQKLIAQINAQNATSSSNAPSPQSSATAPQEP